MGLKLLVNATEDFTGEFRKTANYTGTVENE